MLENLSASGAGIWFAIAGIANALGWFIFSWWWKYRVFGRMLRDITRTVERVEAMLERLEQLANEECRPDAGIAFRTDE